MIAPRVIGERARSTAASALSGARFAAPLLLALAFMVGGTAVLAGNLDRIVLFDIKAQTLDQALLQLGSQADMRISFACDRSKTLQRTSGIRGDYTAREALARLLKGTRLRYIAHARTVEILSARQADPRGAADAGKPLDTAPLAYSAGAGGTARAEADPPAVPEESHKEIAARPLEEVIVTAQKYRQTAFAVPISLQVLSGRQILQHEITNLSKLQYDVPGLYMNRTGISQQIFLRGVGNDFGSGAMVGEYIDEADITAESVFGGIGYGPGDNQLYDLKRVEVLKGPQGTLYGDGSMGGVIRYITNKPDLDGFEMSAHVASTLTQDGGPGQRIEAMLNTPLIDGKLGLRVAGTFAHEGGWVDEPAANLKNVNAGDLADARAEALWRPTEKLTVNAMQIIRRNAYGMGTGENAHGDLTPVFYTALVPHATDSADTSNLFVTYALGGADLKSSSTWLSEEQNTYNLPNSQAFGGVTFWALIPHQHLEDESFSEELRLANAGAGPWQWTVGGFYKSYRYSVAQSEYFGLAGSPLSSALYFPAIIDVSGEARSLAEFADSSYRLFGRLTIGAGVRYFRDRETSQSKSNLYSPTTFTSTDPRAYVQYRVTSHVSTYASASKGFRSGGFNYLPTLPTYGPETLWSYDLGTKLRLPARDLIADVDVFYSNYSHFVSVTDVPLAGVDLNVGDARIRGIDGDVTWRPTAGWRMSLNAEILSTEFLTATAVSGFAPGDRLPYAPRYSFTGAVTRDFRWRGRPGDVEVNYYEISRVQFRQAGFPLMQSDVLRLLGARASIRWSDALRLGLFVHNILNDRGFESPFGPLFNESERPEPRTLGVEFDVRFE